MYFILLHTLAQTTSSQFDHALRKDMFSFYKFLEKPIFVSLGEVVDME